MDFGARKHVLDGGAHLRHLANGIESSCAAVIRPFCQITLTTCLNVLVSVMTRRSDGQEEQKLHCPNLVLVLGRTL